MIRLIPDGKTDNFPAFMDYLRGMTMGGIVFPDGECFFSQTLPIYDKFINLIGSNFTTLVFPQGVTGIHIKRPDTTRRSRIVNINTRALGNRFDADKKILHKEAHGILIEATVDVEHCTAANFGGVGIAFHGSISGNDTRASNSTVVTSMVSGCGHGFFVEGKDANSIGFQNCDARNNEGYGFWDSSFLGSKFFNCMGHNNKKGHFHTGTKDDGSDARSIRSNFFGCYQEDDGTPPSVIGGYSMAMGGNKGPGWKTIHNAVYMASPKDEYGNNKI